MKKLSIFFATLVAMASLSSCMTDKDPVYKAPTDATAENFKIYGSAFQDQLFDLGVDTDAETFTITLSGQPDYGYSAITTYSALVSLTEDFADYRELASAGTGTQSVMTLGAYDLGAVLCELKGWNSADEFKNVDPFPVYFKGVAELSGVEGSRVVTSNYCTFTAVKVSKYFKRMPGFIYLVGDCQGWVEPKADNKDKCDAWRLFENEEEIGSKIYHATFTIPEGKAMFRFYTELNGWGDDGCAWCLGYKAEDAATEVEFDNNVYEYEMVNGKGSFNFSTWPGGTMDITVDMSQEGTNLLTIIAHPVEE